MATSQWPLLSIILLPGVPARAPRHFWCLGTVENPLSPKISRRNTQELAQPPPHLLKPEFTSYSRFAYSKNNTWMCSWAPSSSQQGLNLQSQHVWIFESSFIVMLVLSYCCSIFNWSSGEKNPPFAEPVWFPSLLQYNYSCCAAILAAL